MKVIHLNHSDINGGAARAAFRIKNALRDYGLESNMIVNQALSDDWTVSSPKGKLSKLIIRARAEFASIITKMLKTQNPIIHSPAFLPSNFFKKINASDADVIHMHWINNEMISVEDIGRISKPIVWTLHDMWAFCGAEHYTEDRRWQDGYMSKNRPTYEGGFDLNRWTWNRKIINWKTPIHIVAPSRWLAECANKSLLMRDWPITVIPLAIDVETWKPIDKGLARKLLNLPLDAHLILFGAIGGTHDPRKGFDLLTSAIKKLTDSALKFELVVFGQSAPEKIMDHGLPVHFAGCLHDDISLRLLYSAADVMVVPSRQEAFGQTGSEAHACGCPVVAFDATGLTDVVEHRQTGYLAEPFNSEDLAKGIEWVLIDDARQRLLSANARERAVRLWSYRIVAAQYLTIYSKALKSKCL